MELDRIVPNSIVSGGPEDLNVIELLWKQDVDLGVGKEVYDHSLREELERKQEQEYLKQQEQRKAQLAAREKEELSRQLEASRWLNQNYSRDGETGEWVKRQNRPFTKGESAGTNSLRAETDEVLTLEAALDYLSNNVVANSNLEVNTDRVVPVPETSFQLDNDVDDLQATITVQGLQAENLSPEHSPRDLENQWFEMDQYLNVSLPDAEQQQTLSMPELSNDLGLLPHEYEVDDSSKLDMLNPMLDLDQHQTDNLLTSSDILLLQNASLHADDQDNAFELGNVTLTNLSGPPAPCNMNTSLDWESEDIHLFDNLTTLPQGSIDDVDLQGVEDLFLTTEASDLFTATTEASDLFTATTDLGDASSIEMAYEAEGLALPTKSFAEDLNDTFDGLEGATGGADYSSPPYRKMSRLSESSSDSGFGGKGAFSSSSSSSSSYAGSPADSNLLNNETNSNDTDHDPHGSKVLAHQVAHNHTYNTLPGHTPREVKKYAHKEPSKKGPQCRDARRAQELKIPFTIEEIVNSPVETFNEILTKYSLTEDQLTLIRDIRRRGKNKLAAQNCRKRKVGVIVTLEDEMVELQKVRDRLRAERAAMDKESRMMKEKFSHLYSHIFQSLRDEHGQPYNRNNFSLQQSSDGNIFLVPRNMSMNGEMNSTSLHSNGSSPGKGAGQDNDHSVIKKGRSDS